MILTRYFWLSLVVGIAGCFGACAGGSGPTEDSESHFVRCKLRADCEKLGEGYSCTKGRCELTQGNDLDPDAASPSARDMDASSSENPDPPKDQDSGMGNGSAGGAGPDEGKPDAGTPPAPKDVLDPNQDLEPYKFTSFHPGFPDDSEVSGIATGPDGRLWFASIGHPNLYRLNADGTWTEVTARFGDLHRLVSGPGGNLWVSRFNGSQILKVSPTDGVVTALPGQDSRLGNTNLWDITLGPAGEIAFVGENYVGRFQTIGAGDTPLTKHPTEQFAITNGFGSVVFGPDDHLWVGASGGFLRVSRQGEVTPVSIVGAPGCGTLLSVGQQVWVFCTNNVLYRYAAGGAQLNSPGMGGQVSTVVLAPDGTVWGLNTAGTYLGRWGADGLPQPGFVVPAEFGPFSQYFPEMAIGPDGHLWLPMQRGVVRFTLPKMSAMP